jgi:hypothetical protein
MSKKAVLRTAQDIFALDNAFFLIDGMTRVEQILFGRVATWTDGVESGYSAKTADPCTALLRSSGRDDKGRASTFRKDGDSDGRS